MKVSASASLTAGQVEQAAYDAENAVMTAKVPAYRQSYTGTRLGFSAKSRKWLALSDGISVKPHLKVTSMRTRASVNDPVWLRQSDKVGALSFENATVLQGMPKSLNVVGIGTDVKTVRFARRLASGIRRHGSRRRVSARGSGGLPHAVLIGTQQSLAGGGFAELVPATALATTIHSGG